MEVFKEDIYKMISELLEINVENVKDIDKDEDLTVYGMTSISFIQLIVMLEEKYNFDCKDEDLLIEKFNTFAKLFSLLEI